MEQEILGRETSVGVDHQARAAEINEKLGKERAALAELEKHWDEEKTLVGKILELRAKLRAAGSTIEAKPNEIKPEVAVDKKAALTPQERDAVLSELKSLQEKLAAWQGESPCTFPSVDQNAIASVVADCTSIPVGRMVKNEIDQVLKLADLLERRVIGQRHALEIIAKRVQTNRARLGKPHRPIGVFILLGPART